MLALLSVLFLSCERKIDYSSLSEEEQHEPVNALASMTLARGVEATLFASEPMMFNPTNMDIDAQGRVWVIEALNYRNPHNPENPYREDGDRILILEDTDGDGKADNQKVFYQGEDINSALGIAVLGNKVIVSLSPNIFVFTDEDGDDVADGKEVLFTGMGGNQSDHGVHAFVFGPDGKLYFNFGNNGEQLLYSNGDPVLDRLGNPINNSAKPYRQGMAFRCDMDGSNVEVLGHNFRNNYELAVDSYGTIWQSDNDDDGNRGVRINYVMPYGNYGYRDEITGAGWRTRRIGMHDSIPIRHWHQNDPGVVPNLLQTGSGSPCGMVFYEGDLLPGVFHHQMIHAEAGHQVTRAYPLKPEGAGYSAEIVNLMKSQDKWHRPSDVCVAPDGSVFVADWYDPGVGGHRMGDVQRGRIFRIAPPNTAYKVPMLEISNIEGAIEALQRPNLAMRYLAWTALHEQDAAAEQALVELYENGEPHIQARALWLLGKIDGKSATYVQKGLAHENPDLRITALRLALQEDEANLLDYVKQLVDDKNPQVRREAALALHFEGSAKAAHLWAQLAVQHEGNDRWYLEALGIAADLHPELFFETYLNEVGDEWNSPGGKDIIWRMRSPKTIPMLVELIKQTTEVEALERYFRALHFQPEVSKDAALAILLDGAHPEQSSINAYAMSYLSPDFSRQNAALIERILPSVEGSPEWLDAVKSMELKHQRPKLLEMLLTNENTDMQKEAGVVLMKMDGAPFLQEQWTQMQDTQRLELLAALGKIDDGNVIRFLKDCTANEALPLALRQKATESLGNTWGGRHLLADLINENQLDEALQTTAALKLINAWEPPVKETGFRILQAAKGGNTDLPAVEELIAMEGKPLRGRYVFETYCATCHQVKGEGMAFGPDLSEIGSKLAKEALYTSIFYPSAGINFGFEGYVIKTKDGSTYQGYIESETEDMLTLRMMGGTAQEIEQQAIVSREEMKQSLMTANLEAAMTQEELVNLVEYLSSLKAEERLSSR